MTRIRDLTDEQLREAHDCHSKLAASYHEAWTAAQRRSKLYKREIIARNDALVARLLERREQEGQS